MHRTQILLEEEQYEALRARASRDGKSLGQLIRELLASALGTTSGRKQGTRKLSGLKGMFHEPGVRGRDHDRYLYGGK